MAYIHLHLDEIFGLDQWFGGVNVLFVGDILQLPPVNGAPVFDRITSKAVAQKLGCMTSLAGHCPLRRVNHVKNKTRPSALC